MQLAMLSSTEQEIVKSVSRERLMAEPQAIARRVRLSGTEDEHNAFEYIAGVLRQLDVQPPLYTGYGHISLPVSAQLRAGQNELRARTHSLAAGTPAQGGQLSDV